MENSNFIKEILLALKSELIRYRVACLVLSISVLFLVMIFGLNWDKKYVSTATLEIDASNIIQPLLRGRAEFTAANRVEEAKQTIASRRLIESVARELGYIDDATSMEDIEKIIEVIRQNVFVQSGPGTGGVLFISYSSTDATVAFETLRVIVKQLVNYHKMVRQAEGENAYGFINKRVEVYKSRLEKADENLKDFKADSHDIDEETVQRRIGDLEDDIQELVLSIQEDESKIQTTKVQINKESEYLETQSRLFTLSRRRAGLEKELSELRMQFQDSYPDVVTIRQQLDQVINEIDTIKREKNISPRSFSSRNSAETNPEQLFDELRTQLSDDQRELTAKKKRLISLRGMVAEQHGKMEIVATNQAEHTDLMREYKVTKEVYEEMLSRLQNAELSVAITAEGQGLAYIILEEPTYPLSPTGLTFLHFILVAPVFSIGAPIGILLAFIILDPSIRTVGGLRNGDVGEMDIDILGISPHYHSAFTDRLLKKDMLLFTMVGALAAVVYMVLAFIGFKA